MPERNPAEKECPHCSQIHSEKDDCEGFGFPMEPYEPMETPQVDSPYLRKELAKFKKEQAKKKKEEREDA